VASELLSGESSHPTARGFRSGRRTAVPFVTTRRKQGLATGSRDSVTQRDLPRPRDQSEVAVLWTASEVRCVLARYDETRYQLRLLRGLGTIKTELFADCAKAIVASHDWRQQVRGIEPPDAVA
jgi:hypothetical protein